MKRRDFLRDSALLTVAAAAAPELLSATEHQPAQEPVDAEGPLIVSAPMPSTKYYYRIGADRISFEPGVVARFEALVRAGVYPTPLWK